MKYPYKAKISYKTTEIQDQEIIKIEKTTEINVNVYFCNNYIILVTEDEIPKCQFKVSLKGPHSNNTFISKTRYCYFKQWKVICKPEN